MKNAQITIEMKPDGFVVTSKFVGKEVPNRLGLVHTLSTMICAIVGMVPADVQDHSLTYQFPTHAENEHLHASSDEETAGK